MRTALSLALCGYALVTAASVEIPSDPSTEELVENNTNEANLDDSQPLAVAVANLGVHEDESITSSGGDDDAVTSAVDAPEIELTSMNSTTTAAPVELGSLPSENDSVNDGDSVSSRAEDDAAEEAVSAAINTGDNAADESLSVEEAGNQGNLEGGERADDDDLGTSNHGSVLDSEVGDGAGNDEEASGDVEALAVVEDVESEETTTTVAPDSEQSTEMVV